MRNVKHAEYDEDSTYGSVHEVNTLDEAAPGAEQQHATVPIAPVAQYTETVTTNRTASWMVRRRYGLTRVTQFVWLAVDIIEVLLGVRFVLKLIGANPAAGFAQLIYGLSVPFMVPFYNLTTNPAAVGLVIEITTLIAMLVYALLGWLIVKLIWVLFYRPPYTTAS